MLIRFFDNCTVCCSGLKGQCHEIFTPTIFVHLTYPSGPLIITLQYIFEYGFDLADMFELKVRILTQQRQFNRGA